MWHCVYKGNFISVSYRGHDRGDYTLLREPYCLKCACPNVTTEKCSWHWDDYGFDRMYAMGSYYSRGILKESGTDDLLSDHILGLKKYPRYAVPLGLGLVECIRGRYPELMGSDLIVPTPLFTTELKVSRDPPDLRFNQSVELSKVVSSELGIGCKEVLAKTREQRMRGLARAERKEAVRGLYGYVGKEEVKGKQVLIIDDVSTSGATASECARVLMDSGAKRVNVLVAGRDTV